MDMIERKWSDDITRELLQIKLKDEFSWFISDEFKKLREGFTPSTEEEERGHERKKPLSAHDDDNNDNSDNNNSNKYNNSNNNKTDTCNDDDGVLGGKFLSPPQLLAMSQTSLTMGRL